MSKTVSMRIQHTAQTAALKQHGGADSPVRAGRPRAASSTTVLSRSAIAPPNRRSGQSHSALRTGCLLKRTRASLSSLIETAKLNGYCRSTSPSTLTGRLPGTLVSASPRISDASVIDVKEGITVDSRGTKTMNDVGN